MGSSPVGALAPNPTEVFLYSYLIAVVLNAYLLVQVAWGSRAFGWFPMAVLGAAFAGIWDGVKIAAVGLDVWVLRGLFL